MKAERALLKELKRPAGRESLQRVVIEGIKLVREALTFLGAPQFVWLLDTHPLPEFLQRVEDAGIVRRVKVSDMAQVSGFETPSPLLAVFQKPGPPPSQSSEIRIQPGWRLGLDRLQNPGNLGTILRSAEWFGLGQVVLSEGCADPWNPKTIAASMGSVFRVPTLQAILGREVEASLKAGCTVLAADLEGESLFSADLPRQALLLLGSEGQGLAPELLAPGVRRITIPRGRPAPQGPESLNAAQAATLFMAEWARRYSNT